MKIYYINIDCIPHLINGFLQNLLIVVLELRLNDFNCPKMSSLEVKRKSHKDSNQEIKEAYEPHERSY